MTSPESKKPEIIDTVPGVTRSQGGLEATDLTQVTHVETEGFMGDPRRVIGHPSNPTSEMSQAYTENLASNEKLEPVAEHLGGTALSAEVTDDLNRAISEEELAKLRDGLS